MQCLSISKIPEDVALNATASPLKSKASHVYFWYDSFFDKPSRKI